MHEFACPGCGAHFLGDFVAMWMQTPRGPQPGSVPPPCPQCWQRGYTVPGVYVATYHPAPTHVVGGQVVYDYTPPRQPSLNASAKSFMPSGGNSGLPNSSPPTGTSKAVGSSTSGNGQSTAVVPMQTAIPPVNRFELLPENVIELITSFLDERSMGLVSLVCKRFQKAAQLLLPKFVPPMIACGSSNAKLKDVIKRELQSVTTIKLAVDKFPASAGVDSIIAYLIEKNVDLTLTLGENNPKTLTLLQKGLKNFRSLPASDRLHKMHNKFWVLDNEGVITGSPNVSFAGLEGGNLESFIIIRSPRVASLFTDYLSLLQSNNPFGGAQYNQLKSALTQYNSEEHQLKLAMAPVINITDFVIENLQGAKKIIIRQFLISPKKDRGPSKDILSLLCGMAQAGTEIEMYLDQGQYESQGFVRQGVSALLSAGCKVYLQKPVLVVTANESLMHDKLILATLHSGVQRTLLGSAGFTSNVIANDNAENFICTDVQSIYDACLKHHQESLTNPKVMKTQLTL